MVAPIGAANLLGCKGDVGAGVERLNAASAGGLVREAA